MSDHLHPPSSDPFGDAIAIDCGTCVAANTTACNECVVMHLLANDAGPIELVVADGGDPETPGDPVERIVGLLVAVGLCDDPPVEVSDAEFDSFASRPVPVH